ncbi:MAG: nucleotidyltransferase family protein [Acidimicrobiia bacterium]
MSVNAAIILAAGSSERFGSSKQLVDLNDRPLLEHIVTDVLAWPVDTVVVVIGAFADEILDAIDFQDAVVAINEDWSEGLSSSLRVGLDVLTRDPKWDRTFVALGDQPNIPPAVPGELIAVAEETQRPAVVPVYRYARGHPVLFDRSLWSRLMTLAGDAGASPLLTTHPEFVEEVRFSDLPPRDIDIPDDLVSLRAGGGRSTRPDGGH